MDHIAAIDNTTRKLVHEGKKPVGVGLFFSLGHSTVVVLLALGIVAAGSFVAHNIPSLEAIGGVIGTGISAIFLYLIGILNVIVFLDVYSVYRRLDANGYDETEIDKLLAKRGLMNRIFGKRLRFIRSSWQMYPVGFLFGLGFDTATEVALLAITGLAAASMPASYIMILPFMFMAGMTLLDTADGIIMLHAYNWAFKNLLGKVFYNMTITAASILVAFFIGGIEWMQVAAMELGMTGGIWGYVRNVDFGTIGVGIVAIFVGTWAVSALIYRRRNSRNSSLARRPRRYK